MSTKKRQTWQERDTILNTACGWAWDIGRAEGERFQVEIDQVLQRNNLLKEASTTALAKELYSRDEFPMPNGSTYVKYRRPEKLGPSLFTEGDQLDALRYGLLGAPRDRWEREEAESLQDYNQRTFGRRMGRREDFQRIEAEEQQARREEHSPHKPFPPSK